MTKVHLFANIAGKSAKYSNDYFCDNYSEKNKQLTNGIIEIVAEHNEKNTHKISCKLNEELNLLEVSNGQTFRMRKPSKLGTISVHSDHIKACGVCKGRTKVLPCSFGEAL